MVWLAVDTSGPWCAVRVRAGAQDVERREQLERGHDRVVALMTRDVLADADCAPEAVTGVAVCVGPGSFAGVRVGVAFARGFACVRGVEAVGVTALDVWGGTAHGDGAGLSAGVHDARRGEVVWRAFRAGAPVGAPQLSRIEEARAALTDLGAGAPVALAGSGAALMVSQAQDDAALVDTGVRDVDLGVMVDQAIANPAPARPFYHRPPDADPPKSQPKPLNARV